MIRPFQLPVLMLTIGWHVRSCPVSIKITWQRYYEGKPEGCCIRKGSSRLKLLLLTLFSMRGAPPALETWGEATQ